MLTVLALAAATICPPLPVRVTAGPEIPKPLVTQTLAEAAAIWRTAGVTVAWEVVEPPLHHVNVVDEHRAPAGTPRVIIDRNDGPSRDRGMAIGWILFDETGVPTPEIHLSFSNALALAQNAVGGSVTRLTIIELRTLLARTLGRALAHELGHYLLGSKEHSHSGLMKATRSAWDFTGPSRDGFAIDSELRARIAARLTPSGTLARR